AVSVLARDEERVRPARGKTAGHDVARTAPGHRTRPPGTREDERAAGRAEHEEARGVLATAVEGDEIVLPIAVHVRDRELRAVEREEVASSLEPEAGARAERVAHRDAQREIERR